MNQGAKIFKAEGLLFSKKWHDRVCQPVVKNVAATQCRNQSRGKDMYGFSNVGSAGEFAYISTSLVWNCDN